MIASPPHLPNQQPEPVIREFYRRLLRTLTREVLITVAAFSHSFFVNAVLIARRMLGRASDISWPLSLFALVIKIPCASTSSTTSCSSLSSASISNTCGFLGRAEVGFEGFEAEEGTAVGRRDEADARRTWM
jgi:hypothetical protein